MNEVNFADILFILLVCVVIFVILTFVNRGKKTSSAEDAVIETDDGEEIS